jgi:hypothetical protein
MTWFTRLAQQVRDLAQRGVPPSSDAASRDGDPATPPSTAPQPAGPDAGAALVLGTFQQMTDAEQALSNLDEAGYEPETVSVITNSTARTRTLTDAKGPLSAVAPDALPAHLQALGLSGADAEAYRAALERGDVVLAVAAPAGSAAAAAEILTDEKAQHVTRLPGTPA